MVGQPPTIIIGYVSKNVLRASALQHLIVYRDKTNIHGTFLEYLPAELYYSCPYNPSATQVFSLRSSFFPTLYSVHEIFIKHILIMLGTFEEIKNDLDTVFTFKELKSFTSDKASTSL